jgi:hypothetical protein
MIQINSFFYISIRLSWLQISLASIIVAHTLKPIHTAPPGLTVIPTVQGETRDGLPSTEVKMVATYICRPIIGKDKGEQIPGGNKPFSFEF